MGPDRVSNPGPLTYESGALPTALCSPAINTVIKFEVDALSLMHKIRQYVNFNRN